MPHFTSHGLRLQVAISLGRLVDGKSKRQVGALKKQVSKIKKQFEDWASKSLAAWKEAKTKGAKREHAADLKALKKFVSDYAEVEVAIAASEECGADPACWGRKLADKSVPVRLVAGYRLAQMRGETRPQARDVLVKFGGDQDLVVRNVILFGLRRLGDKSSVAALEEHRKADLERSKKKGFKQFKGAANALELTIAQLQHR